MRANVLGRDLENEMMNPILVTRNMSRYDNPHPDAGPHPYLTLKLILTLILTAILTGIYLGFKFILTAELTHPRTNPPNPSLSLITPRAEATTLLPGVGMIKWQ